MQAAEWQAYIWAWYAKHGRHDLPWRQNITPYRIAVSEIMLQQTQVGRVQEKFLVWMQQWPDWEALSQASQGDVLRAWQGLGYNSRAVRLHALARILADQKHIPETREAWEQFPGIGPYTSGAIMAFAFDQRVVFVDTNIRRVYLHHFFSEQTQVSDAELSLRVEATLPDADYRKWYWALMDYGAHLGALYRKNNPNKRSRHYTRQSAFLGSDRQIRGSIVRVLCRGSLSKAKLQQAVAEDIGYQVDSGRLDHVLQGVVTEGLVQRHNDLYST